MFNYENWMIFLLILIRISAFLAAAPVFSLRNIPVSLKVGFALILSFVLLPQVGEGIELPGQSLLLIVMAVRETLTGLVAGMAASLFFAAIRVGGEFLDIQMGFAMAQIMDPANGMQNSLVSQFMYILGVLLFFSIDAHHVLIMALVKTFDLVPFGNFAWSGSLTLKLVDVFLLMWVYALRIALPVIIVLVITDLSLGFLSKTVPQFNVFMAGFPLKIGIGIISLAVLIPVTGTIIGSMFELFDKQVLGLFGGY